MVIRMAFQYAFQILTKNHIWNFALKEKIKIHYIAKEANPFLIWISLRGQNVILWQETFHWHKKDTKTRKGENVMSGKFQKKIQIKSW